MATSVKIINVCGNKLGFSNPETRTVRSFPVGGYKMMDIEELKNLYYGDDGFYNMIREKYLEIENLSPELAEELGLEVAKPRTPAELLALAPEAFAAALPTLHEGEKAALRAHMQNNDFPISLANAAKEFFGLDFLKMREIVNEEKVAAKPAGFAKKA